MQKPLILTALAALSAASLLQAAPASAAAAALRIGDLDLATEAGKTELARRVDMAVRQACPEEVTTGTRIGNRAGRQQCEADARQQIEAYLARRARTR